MANFTATTTTSLSGTPGSSAGSGTVTVTVVPDQGYRVLASDLSVDNTRGYFENIVSTQSGSNVVITFDLVDSINYPPEDSEITVVVTGEARTITVGIDGCVKFEDDSDPDIDIIVRDTDGDIINGDSLLFDLDDVEPGDEVIIGDVSFNPADGMEFPDSDGDDQPDNIDTDALGLDPPFQLGDGTPNDDGGWDFDIIIVVPDDGGSGIGVDMDPVGTGDVVFVDEDGNPTGGDVTRDTSDDVLTIANVEINVDNIHPTNGGFIVITAVGDPGAVGMVTIDPTVRGGVTIDPAPQPINVDLMIEDNGIDVVTVRIPAAGGDEFVNNPLCSPDLPDDFDGIDWGVEVTYDEVDENGNEVEVTEQLDDISQDTGTAVCFSIVSADDSIPDTADGLGSATANGWRHDTILGPSTRGFIYPNGHISIVIPSGASNWTLLDDTDNDGVVSIDEGIDISRTSSFDSGSILCNGTAAVNSNGDLIINIDYTGGQFQNGKVQYEIDLDNLATLNTEVQIFFTAGNNYSISQTEFAYAGMPGTAVPADGGEVETSVTFTVDSGYTWHDTDIAINLNNFVADAANAANNNITNVSVSPSISSLQNAEFFGSPITEITVSWTLGGTFPQPLTALRNIYRFAANGGPRFISTVDFDFGPTMMGHDTLENARFLGAADVTGIEGRAWSREYNISADTDHVFKAGQLPRGTHQSSTYGAVVSDTTAVSTDPILMVQGTITGTFGPADDTVLVDGQGQGFRVVTLQYALNTNGLNDASVASGFVETITGIEGDPVPAKGIRVDGNSGFGLIAGTAVTIVTEGDTVSTSFLPEAVRRGAFYRLVQYGSRVGQLPDRVFGDEDETVTTTVTGSAVPIPVVYQIPIDLDDVDGVDEGNINTDSVPDMINSNGDIEVEGDGGDTVRVTLCIPSEPGFAIQSEDDLDIEFPDSVTVVSTELRNTADDATEMGGNNILCYTLDIDIPDATGGDVIRETLDPIEDEDGDSQLARLVTLSAYDFGTTTPHSGNITIGPDSGDFHRFTLESNSRSLTPPGWTATTTSGDFFSVSPTSITDDNLTRTVRVEATSDNTSLVDRRTGAFTIASNVTGVSLSITFNVTQNVATPELSGFGAGQVTTTPGPGGTGTFTFTSNDNWILVGQDDDLFIASATSGGPGENTITFTNRGGFSLSPVSDVVFVETTTTQQTDGTPITIARNQFTVTHPAVTESLSLSTNSVTLPQQGGSEDVTVTASLAGWTFAPMNIGNITLSKEDDSTLRVRTIVANATFTAITGSTTVTSQLGSQTETLAVTQEPLVANYETGGVSVPPGGTTGYPSNTSRLDNTAHDSQSVSMASNYATAWSATTASDGFVTLDVASGNVGTNLQFSVAANGEGQPQRSQNIVITWTTPEGPVTTTLAVFQEAGDSLFYRVDGDDAVVGGDTATAMFGQSGGTGSFVLTTNDPNITQIFVSTSDFVNITQNDPTQIASRTVNYTVAANTGDAREEDIAITWTNDDFSFSISTNVAISQARASTPATEFAFSPTNGLAGTDSGATINVISNGDWIIPLTYNSGNNRFGGLTIASSSGDVTVADNNTVTGNGNATLTFTTTGTPTGALITGGATGDGTTITGSSSQNNLDAVPIFGAAATFGGSEQAGTLTDVASGGGTGVFSVSGTLVGQSGNAIRLGSGTSSWISGLTRPNASNNIYNVTFAANTATTERTGSIVVELYEQTNATDGRAITNGAVLGTVTLTVTQEAVPMELTFNGTSVGGFTVPTFLDGGTVSGTTGYEIAIGAGNTAATHYTIIPSSISGQPNFYQDNGVLIYDPITSPYVRFYYESDNYWSGESWGRDVSDTDPGYVWPIHALDNLPGLVPIDNAMRIRLRYHNGFSDRTNTFQISFYSGPSRSQFIGTNNFTITQAANAGTATLTINGTAHSVTDNLEPIIIQVPTTAGTDSWTQNISHSSSVVGHRLRPGEPNSPAGGAAGFGSGDAYYWGFDSDLGYGTRGLRQTDGLSFNQYWIQLEDSNGSFVFPDGDVIFSSEDLVVLAGTSLLSGERTGDAVSFERRLFFTVYFSTPEGVNFRSQTIELRQNSE